MKVDLKKKMASRCDEIRRAKLEQEVKLVSIDAECHVKKTVSGPCYRTSCAQERPYRKAIYPQDENDGDNRIEIYWHGKLVEADLSSVLNSSFF